MERAEKTGGAGTYVSLHTKVSVGFVALAVFTLLVLTAALYGTARRQMREEIRARLRNMAALAASTVDTAAHDRLLMREQEETAEYRAIKGKLKRVLKSGDDYRYAYTMRMSGGGEIVFVVDAEDDPTLIAHVGEVYDDASPLLKKSFSTMREAIVEREFYTDKWGTWLSGYAPLFRPDGGLAGVVGLDIAASKVIGYERQLLRVALTVFACVVPFALVIGWFLGSRLVGPLADLTRSANRIAGGDLTHRTSVATSDETGVLAAAFNSMTRRLSVTLESYKREVDEHKSTAEALMKSEEKFRTLSQEITDGVAVVRDGKCVWLNPAVSGIFGYAGEELIGGEIDVLFPSDDTAGAFARLRQVLFNCVEPAVMETAGRRKNGDRLDVELTAKNISFDGAQSILFVIRDVTERRRAADLVVESKKEAEFYLDLMSHDLTNFNQVIIGNLELMEKQGALDEKGRKYLEAGRKQLSKSENLISRVRAFSRVREAANIELKPIDLAALTTETVETVRKLYPEKRIEVALGFEGEKLVEASELLDSALLNIVENAVKHTQKAPVSMEIDILDATLDGAPAWRLRVADNGPGVPDQMKHKIFERYSRISRDRGLGLGLSLARAVVEKLEGRINVADRRPGDHSAGSVFMITLKKSTS